MIFWVLLVLFVIMVSLVVIVLIWLMLKGFLNIDGNVSMLLCVNSVCSFGWLRRLGKVICLCSVGAWVCLFRWVRNVVLVECLVMV